MVKEYVNTITQIGCMRWVYARQENEYRLYHDSLDLLVTVSENYVADMMESSGATAANVLWSLAGELLWRYFAEHNGFAERAVLKMVCNM